MADPFIGEVRILACNFAPRGWALCDGALMPLSQNIALFSLLGTTYGGNGITTFALPDLRERFVLGPGQGPGLSHYSLGDTGGAAAVALSSAELPSHKHNWRVTATATTQSPGNALLANAAGGAALYRVPGSTAAMSATAVDLTGTGQPHNNRHPHLGLLFCIAMQGVFPPRS